MAPRFSLYVKRAADGGDCGSCPFCMRVYMMLLQKAPRADIHTVTVDFSNKTQEFLKLNPNGTTPVLVDHAADDKVIADSGLIVEYLESLFPSPPMSVNSSDPAVDATKSSFGKFATYMKNGDAGKSEELRGGVMDELNKVESFLSNQGQGRKFLLGDNLSELDCSVYPKLLQIRAAGKSLKGLDVAGGFPAIQAYMTRIEETEACQGTRPTDEDLVSGWEPKVPLKES